MTALELPAPDATFEEWGRLAVSLPGWRWMPGMRAIDSAGEDSPGRVIDSNGFVVFEDQNRDLTEERVSLDDVPDPDDPATAGCLLALLGKRLHIEHGTYLARVVILQEPALHGLYPQGEQKTLGRACIAAAAALGRWPGGEA